MSEGKQIVITGGTGFIGRSLVHRFLEEGAAVTVLSRNPRKYKDDELFSRVKMMEWSDNSTGWHYAINGADAVINLSGRNLASGRWTQAVRRSILDSRVRCTQAIAAAISSAAKPPLCLIQASAVGFYGTRTPINADENTPSGEGFLAEVVRQWEAALESLQIEVDTRIVILRFGVVLGRGGGLHRTTACLVRHYLGSVIGPGSNWMSWIHIDDAVKIISMMVNNEKMHGVFNAVAPVPVRSREYMKKLATLLHRRLIPAPPVRLLRIMLDGMVDELVLASQHVSPRHLNAENFEFGYPDIDSALKSLVSHKEKEAGTSDNDCTKDIRLT
ncbi:TIGR01777 family oxidoreductase [bacterium]|nr:TIGR01777 family oxidoreductase [candidate division CSSED10-310 bacterium]